MKLWVDSPNGGKAFEMGSEYKRKSQRATTSADYRCYGRRDTGDSTGVYTVVRLAWSNGRYPRQTTGSIITVRNGKMMIIYPAATLALVNCVDAVALMGEGTLPKSRNPNVINWTTLL
jgi:hypothetical protein